MLKTEVGAGRSFKRKHCARVTKKTSKVSSKSVLVYVPLNLKADLDAMPNSVPGKTRNHAPPS